MDITNEEGTALFIFFVESLDLLVNEKCPVGKCE